MDGAWLKSERLHLLLENLKAGKFPDVRTEQEKNAVQFCHRWLSNQPEYSFTTSGSTGTPKKITFLRDQLLTSARLTENALQLTAGTTALVCLDVKFIAGAMMLVRAMTTGMNIILTEPSSDPLDRVDDKIDFAAFVPLQVNTMINTRGNKLNRIGTIIIGGAPVDQTLLEKIQSLTVQVYGTYGMTETLSHIALQKLNGIDKQDNFHLLPGISASKDERGCLVIQAPHLGEPIVTQDIISITGERKFKWTGRFDRSINTGGVKVQAEKIESVVATLFEELNLANRFFISGLPDHLLGEKVVLIVEGVLSKEIEIKLEALLKVRLSKYENPKIIFKVDQFLETPSQKIDRVQTLKQMRS